MLLLETACYNKYPCQFGNHLGWKRCIWNPPNSFSIINIIMIPLGPVSGNIWNPLKMPRDHPTGPLMPSSIPITRLQHLNGSRLISGFSRHLQKKIRPRKFLGGDWVGAFSPSPTQKTLVSWGLKRYERLPTISNHCMIWNDCESLWFCCRSSF